MSDSHVASLEWPLHRSVAATARLIDRGRSKQSRSIRNRLHSIAADASFVTSTAVHLGLPLLPNERCGTWYVPSRTPSAESSQDVRPLDKMSSLGSPVSSYFKSTDGHYGEWSFNLRRLNLNVLECVGKAGGCIIVDSTRRGKHMPDALAKTIPIWCSVLNRLLFPQATNFHGLVYNARLISESEASQIETRLASFQYQAQALNLDLDKLREKLKKPMRPFWISRSLGFTAEAANASKEASCGEFHPVYLCMASLYQADGTLRFSQFEYVQGAGDDAESWAIGLDPTTFWKYQDELLRTDESELPDTIARLTKRMHSDSRLENCFPVSPCASILVGGIEQTPEGPSTKNLTIVCSIDVPIAQDGKNKARILHLKCGSGKIGSRDLRTQLDEVPSFIRGKEFEKIFVCCPTGKDLSVGVALALLVLFSDDQGKV